MHFPIYPALFSSFLFLISLSFNSAIPKHSISLIPPPPSDLEETKKEECKNNKEYIRRILSYEENEVNGWLNNYHGYQMLNNYEIIDDILDEKENYEYGNKCSENDSVPSHFECLDRAMKWLEWQKNVDPIQLT